MVVKSFLVDLFQDVDVDSGSVRVALVTYSTDVSIYSQWQLFLGGLWGYFLRLKFSSTLFLFDNLALYKEYIA